MLPKKALYYQIEADQQVRCRLCPHKCLLKPGNVGICRVRMNQDGILYSLNYGQITSLGIDPVEKKPLYHFYPGRLILSVGTFGCNLACPFCQNYTIAHQKPETQRLLPEELLSIARWCYQRQGSVGVAFTYNEPLVWFEYVRECAQLFHEHGQLVVLVTNGHIEAEPWEELLPYIEAVNIDVKAFREEFYHKLCRGSVQTVKDRVEQAARKVHVEVTTLVIPGENDSLDEIESLAAWLASVDPMIPLHLSRYHPAYQFRRPSTPLQTMLEARQRASRHLRFVYLGNLDGENNPTRCVACGHLLIDRNGYKTEIVGLHNGHCRQCGSRVSYIIGS